MRDKIFSGVDATNSMAAVLIGASVGALCGGVTGYALTGAARSFSSHTSPCAEAVAIAEMLEAIADAPDADENITRACQEVVATVDALVNHALAVGKGTARGASAVTTATKLSTAVAHAVVQLEAGIASNVYWKHVAEEPLRIARDTASKKLRYVVDTAGPALGVPTAPHRNANSANGLQS